MNEGDELSLSGLMIIMTYPGAPNYESIADGDTPETVFVLKPNQPINCASNAPTLESFKLIQLVLSNQNDYKRYRKSIGEQVTVAGHLSYSIIGHHHNPLMLEVTSITGSHQ